MRIPINPGESATLKMLRIVRWALARGGRFTAKELQQHFQLNRSTAYRYHAEWRVVFGDNTPPRGRRRKVEPVTDPAKPVISLASLQPAKPTVSLASLLPRNGQSDR